MLQEIKKPQRGRKGEPWYRDSANAFYITLGGKQYKLLEGRNNVANRRLAKKEANRLRDERREQRLTKPQLVIDDKDAIPLDELITRFVEYQKKHRPRSVEFIERVLALFAAEHPNAVASDFFDNPRAIRTWAERQKNWKSAATKKVRVVMVAGMFSWAVNPMNHEQGGPLISRNPFVGHTKNMAKPKKRDEIYTEEQEADIMRLASARFGEFFQALIGTGARPWSEMAKVEAKHLKSENGRLQIVLDEHKNSEHEDKRVIIIPQRLQEMFQRLAEKYPTGPLFRNRAGNAWLATDFTQRLARWKATGKAPWIITGQHNAHACRHTFATRLIFKGVPIATVAKLIGDKPLTVQNHYYNAIKMADKQLCAAADMA